MELPVYVPLMSYNVSTQYSPSGPPVTTSNTVFHGDNGYMSSAEYYDRFTQYYLEPKRRVGCYVEPMHYVIPLVSYVLADAYGELRARAVNEAAPDADAEAQSAADRAPRGYHDEMPVGPYALEEAARQARVEVEAPEVQLESANMALERAEDDLLEARAELAARDASLDESPESGGEEGTIPAGGRATPPQPAPTNTVPLSSVSFASVAPTIDGPVEASREQYEALIQQYAVEDLYEKEDERSKADYECYRADYTTTAGKLWRYRNETLLHRAAKALRERNYCVSAAPSPIPPLLPWPAEPTLDAATGTTGACVICMERRVATISVSCSHMTLCVTCASHAATRPATCPVCRKPMTHIIRAYLPE
jgi:hypothetical protein